jgi:DNA-binding transcriptional regulator/RsmH inhibitor MraZ
LPTFPPVGMSVVQTDGKGRIRLPLEVRKRVGARRFNVVVKQGVIELQPLPDVKGLKGKYRNLIKNEWEELEEKAEKLVAKGRR